MVSTSTSGNSESGGSPSSSGANGIVEFLKTPIGIAAVGGFGAAIIAGYFII